ncbi:predicted protein [Pyrenophora tritici-repentis Pt-1C-BFP]|uniref:Uncharacterized protein n=1 Tax=Pyrenophora tritici-repentis (strain Pt-1C-BFP) TaxID=426418 RepID=B2VW17_PYRTR|nr:uncharacterized protein PTRG_01379 [Pyrenophora tritici-repentis Pt-1C-BFP]XP_001940954.1 uncharacterized protein PTRG_10623 [Pyrenophora tritici-repentis Pt-1C-BFP]XP_001941759.1 uncharacterized protein PTRG_11428 [Pyrenophora tritici-repentis Pt-1C-BFP]EDU40817.1 hypothetical protein PTRG_01379 [Pyrenophora tritici-repentis Pt-1C-BFP]EDU43673.1 hypothetical protein PTRG_10623 [Pyrenophora tritici-repentis Pt-1C-BFP]EDU44478.1 predicted protein [Pyrenophora tritici-repentis Pt-1C-BFP]
MTERVILSQQVMSPAYALACALHWAVALATAKGIKSEEKWTIVRRSWERLEDTLGELYPIPTRESKRAMVALSLFNQPFDNDSNTYLPTVTIDSSENNSNCLPIDSNLSRPSF